VLNGPYPHQSSSQGLERMPLAASIMLFNLAAVEDKKNNQKISRERVLNKNVIGMLKRFKIIADHYRNCRKRFCLRFNLIAEIYNLELNL
jgi:hypothetical protein